MTVLSTLALLAGSGLLQAQQSPAPNPPPPAAAAAPAPLDSGLIIQRETKVVLVDAVVTNRKGDYVADLKAQDFRVKEDGKPQTIQNFAFEAETNPTTPERTHYLVLLFDNSTMNPEDQVRARKAAAKFIENNAGPGRMMAVVNFGGKARVAQNFTTNPERLKASVNGVSYSAVAPNDGGIGPAPMMSSGLASVGQDYGARDVIQSIRSLAKSLSSTPGRKIVVWFTSGFLVGDEQIAEVTATISECNRDNVAIYPLDVRGLTTGALALRRPTPPQGFSFQPVAFVQRASIAPQIIRQQTGMGTTGSALPTGLDSCAGAIITSLTAACDPSHGLMPQIPDSSTPNQQVMFMLADGTGGFVIHDGNDLLGGLLKIGKEQNQYYLLEYTPPFSKEGTCHVLQVKVERSGMHVRARTGYCSPKPPDPLKGDPMEKTLVSKMSSAHPGPVNASIRLPFFYTSPNVARVNVAMELASSALKFVKKQEAEHAEVSFVGIAYTPDGAVAARFSDTLMLNLPAKVDVDELKQKPLHYEKQFDIAAGKYVFKIAFTEGGQNFGAVEMPLEIEPFDADQFGVSDLALSKEYHRAAMGLDATLLEDRTPLIADGLQVVPAGSSVFTESDLAIFYMEIYAPVLAASNPPRPPAVGFQLRVLDLKTGEVKYDSKMSELDPPAPLGNPVVPLIEKVPVSMLGPGSYQLEITAADSAGHSAKRTADFEMR